MSEKLSYQCCGVTISVEAEWDQSVLRCPFCTELLVKPVVPDLGSDEDRRKVAARDELREQFARSAEALVRTCPNCGRTLTDLKCKLVCGCGYYLSCSDFL